MCATAGNMIKGANRRPGLGTIREIAMRTLMLFLPCVLALASCAHTAAGLESSARQITIADAAMQKAVADKDLDLIVSFYADDAVLLPTAEPIVVGKPAIRDEWRHILAIPDFQNRSELTRVDVSSGGDMAYSMGTYVALMLGEDGTPASEPGKYLTVWKREAGGAWRIVADTYNTDVPPPDHK